MSSSSKNPQIYVGGLSRKTREEDLEKTFEKFGKVKDFIFKSRYAFIVSKFHFILCRNSRTIMPPGKLWTRWTERTWMAKSSLLSSQVSNIS